MKTQTLSPKNLLPDLSRLAATALLLFLTAGAFAQTAEFGILRDVSEIDSAQCTLDGTELFRTVLADLDLKGSVKGVNLRTATFGVNRIPNVQLAELPEQNRFFGSSTQRNEDIRKFLAKAKRDIEQMAGEPCGQSQTNLYRALMQMTGQFDPEAEQKTLIIISDFIEVSSAFNVNTYIRNPAAMAGEDYEAIVQALERDGQLPELSGTDVVLVTPQTNDVQMWAARFWEKLLTAKGASVTTRASY